MLHTRLNQETLKFCRIGCDYQQRVYRRRCQKQRNQYLVDLYKTGGRRTGNAACTLTCSDPSSTKNEKRVKHTAIGEKKTVTMDGVAQVTTGQQYMHSNGISGNAAYWNVFAERKFSPRQHSCAGVGNDMYRL